MGATDGASAAVRRPTCPGPARPREGLPQPLPEGGEKWGGLPEEGAFSALARPVPNSPSFACEGEPAPDPDPGAGVGG